MLNTLKDNIETTLVIIASFATFVILCIPDIIKYVWDSHHTH